MSNAADGPFSAACGGFTLLEVLVALAILGIGLGVIFEGLGMALRLRSQAAESVRLAVAAERVLGALPARKAAPAEAEEGEIEGVRWRLEPQARAPELVGGVPVTRGAELADVRLTFTGPSGAVWELTTVLPLAPPQPAQGAAR